MKLYIHTHVHIQFNISKSHLEYCKIIYYIYLYYFTAFQIAFTDFELELINNEANREEENDEESDEDTFITYRKQNHVTFMDNVTIHKSPTINYDDDNAIFGKVDAVAQTKR